MSSYSTNHLICYVQDSGSKRRKKNTDLQTPSARPNVGQSFHYVPVDDVQTPLFEQQNIADLDNINVVHANNGRPKRLLPAKAKSTASDE